MTLNVSRSTRKDVLDWLMVEGIPWPGRLSEETFLDRLVDLDALPSTDPRFATMRADLWQHTVNNDDWDSDWVYTHKPLGLLEGTGDLFLRFLTEMLHPVVRPDTSEARRLAQELNDLLRQDGVELVETSTIGTRPVWMANATFGTGSIPRHVAPATSNAIAPELERIWTPGMIRLFLSHVSAHKVEVSRLKNELRPFGVSAFVAHEDIEPSSEWQDEILVALLSMDAMAAILTEDFHESWWTDQEVGVAIGRQVLVIPIRLPETPYGFMGKYQALSGSLTDPKSLASRIADILLRRPKTRDAMREALTVGLEKAWSYRDARSVADKIISVTGFSTMQLQRMEAAVTENDQVSNSFGVATRLRAYIADRQQT